MIHISQTDIYINTLKKSDTSKIQVENTGANAETSHSTLTLQCCTQIWRNV